MNIYVNGWTFANRTRQNQICDFIFDRRCNQSFQWSRTKYRIISIVAQPFVANAMQGFEQTKQMIGSAQDTQTVK